MTRLAMNEFNISPRDPRWADPAFVDDWLDSQQEQVCAYLHAQSVPTELEALDPGWSIPPLACVWYAATQVPDPRAVWVISGDLPTDYIPGAWARSDREAVTVFAQRWLAVSENMVTGLPGDGNVGVPAEWPTLGPLLRSRAEFLLEMASDDANWSKE
jgi:hypothetical protein